MIVKIVEDEAYARTRKACSVGLEVVASGSYATTDYYPVVGNFNLADSY